MLPVVSAIVLAYGPEPLLEDCVAAVLASEGVRTEVVLVDNGCLTGAVERLEDLPGVVVVRPGRNTGFAGGCNLGVQASSGDVVALVNGDAVVTPGALSALVAALEDPAVGMASGSLRLLEEPETMNSAGNPVHYLGFSWAGALGEPASEHAQPVDIASATGAAVALRREVWDDLGGFWEEMFAYCEDAELSLRCWQRGLTVRFVPEAEVRHRYEFSRNDLKFYLLERNRLLLVLTLLERRTLAVLAPALAALELVVLLMAWRDGWARQKIRGWGWLLRNRGLVRARRALVQESRLVSDADLLPRLFTDTFAPGGGSGMSAPRVLNLGSALYWRVAKGLLRRA